MKLFKNTITVIFFIFIFIYAVPVYADEAAENPAQSIEDVLNEQLNSDEMETINDELNKYLGDNETEFLEGKSSGDIMKDILEGKTNLSFPEVIKWIGSVVFKELGSNINILISIIVAVSICAFFVGFQMRETDTQVNEVAFYVCYAVIISMTFKSLWQAMDIAREAIASMTGLMNAATPPLMVLTAASGGTVSAAVTKPFLLGAVTVLGNILRNIFLPVFFMAGILSIVDNLSERIKVKKLLEFIKKIASWALGISMTVFVAILAIQGIATKSVNSIAGKTVKFAAGSFIPVVGKYLADSFDTVIACSEAIKNTAGIGVMIGLIVICAAPALKIFSIVILFRMTCAAVQPISDGRISDCLSGIADSMNFMAGVTALTGVLFVISVTLAINIRFG